MASVDSDRRSELRRRIQQLQSALAGLDGTGAAAAAEAEVPEEATLETLSKKMGDAERRLLGRFKSSEQFFLNQLDEQLLGTVMIVGLFILTAFYVFYFLMENLLRLRRCRCPDVSPNDWNILLQAARYQCNKRDLEAGERNPEASAAATGPAPTVVKTIVLESCASAAH